MTITSSDFYGVHDGRGGVILVPRRRLQQALDRFYEREAIKDAAPPMRHVRTRDAAPQNNLGRSGSAGFLPGSWSRDAGAEGSTGSQGSPAGGAPRRPERQPTRPALRAGAFTTDQPPGHSSTSQQYRHPYRPYTGRSENDDEATDRVTGSSTGHGLPMRAPDQEEEPDEGLGDIIARHTLPPPGEGEVYRLEPQPDGSVAVVCIPDPGDDLSTHDRTFKHRIRDGVDPVLKRMNSLARYRYSRARTKDYASEVRRVIFHHTPLPSERMELVQKDDGSVDIVIWSPSTDLTGEPPPAIQRFREDNRSPGFPAQNWAASPGSRPGERSIHEIQEPIRTGDSAPSMLKAMNRANAEFWRRSA